MQKYLSIAAILGLSLNVGNALAIPVNGTGLLTSDVIFGSGNADGSWTGENQNGVEVALRGKLRYDLAGNPQNIFNYDGDHTYTFDPAASTAPLNRSIFNFEFSVNSNSDGSTGLNLDALFYILEYDTDPGAGTSFTTFDPLTTLVDNFYGNNATANGAGTVGTFAALGGSNNVAQNSQNMGFGYLANPQTNGIYSFNLRVLSAAAGELASTSIDIRVGDDPQVVPAPGILVLFGLGLAALGFTRRQKAL